MIKNTRPNRKLLLQNYVWKTYLNNIYCLPENQYLVNRREVSIKWMYILQYALRFRVNQIINRFFHWKRFHFINHNDNDFIDFHKQFLWALISIDDVWSCIEKWIDSVVRFRDEIESNYIR